MATTTDNPVLNTNAEYDIYSPIWKLVRDVVKGEPFVKAEGTLYLPYVNPSDRSQENKVRNEQYLARASLLGATGRTESGMMGMVFNKPPEISLPAEIEYLIDNVDGSGIGLEQQSQETLKHVLETGRNGLLCEFPETEGATSIQDQVNSGISASIVSYPAESILDWDTKTIGGKTVVSFVKLKETQDIRSDDMLTVETVTNIRVLMLDEDNLYIQKFYDGLRDGGVSQIARDIVPRKGDGSRLDKIPFFFVGSVNNRSNIDPAPLQEIAELNIKHFRNNADFEESSFIVGQPTLALMGMTSNWMKDIYPNGIPFGARAGISGPVGCTAQLIQAQPNSMPQEGMKHKEQQMIALGARLIVDGGQAETAEAARIKHSSDVSVLSIIVSNISKAYTDAVNACLDFMSTSNSGDQCVFEIDQSFFIQELTPEQAIQLMALWQGDLISKEVAQRKLVKGGIISDEIDLDEMNEAISETMTGFTPDE